jgi:alkylation response protein AidB-like acyl-CoA dehydrogenase
MQILPYSVAHQHFRQRLGAFLDREVTPHVTQWEKDGSVPKHIWRQMGQAGFLCPMVEQQYGGLGGDFLYAVIVTEELSQTHHTGLAAALHSDVVVPYIASFASSTLKDRYLPGCVSGEIVTAIAMTEPNAGSDLAGMQTSAEESDAHVVINGAKTFISNGLNADLYVVAAKDPTISNPYEAVSLYLVPSDTPGFTTGAPLNKMGWHSQDTAELFFSQCRIPKINRLGEKGMGFLMLMQKLQQERLMTAIGAVAAAERILEWITAYCRQTVRGGKPLSRIQGIQFALVEMATEVKLGRTFLDSLILDHMAAQDVIVETAMAKYWTTEMVRRIADRSIDICGPEATLETCPLARAWRDVRVMSIFAGTNEIMKGIAAKFMHL